jgi:hypothetical protein
MHTTSEAKQDRHEHETFLREAGLQDGPQIQAASGLVDLVIRGFFSIGKN